MNSWFSIYRNSTKLCHVNTCKYSQALTSEMAWDQWLHNSVEHTWHSNPSMKIIFYCRAGVGKITRRVWNVLLCQKAKKCPNIGGGGVWASQKVTGVGLKVLLLVRPTWDTETSKEIRIVADHNPMNDRWNYKSVWIQVSKEKGKVILQWKTCKRHREQAVRQRPQGWDPRDLAPPSESSGHTALLWAVPAKDA